MITEKPNSTGHVTARVAPLQFAKIYEQHNLMITKLVYKLVIKKKIADGVIMKIWTIAHSLMLKYDPEKGSVLTWLRAIAKRVIKDFKTDQSTAQQQHNQSMTEQANVPEPRAAVIQNLDSQDLKNALMQLSRSERELIDMHYIGGYSKVEIANKIKLPLHTIRLTIAGALKKLRVLLSDNGDAILGD